MLGILIGVLPFFSITWPWYILARAGQALGYTGESHGIIFIAPFFYAVVIAILGYYGGRILEKRKKL